jgi:hypothetical protein
MTYNYRGSGSEGARGGGGGGGRGGIIRGHQVNGWSMSNGPGPGRWGS